MTLPLTNDLSFSAINVELGRSSTSQLSINDSSIRIMFGLASGAVDLNSGHGKTFGLTLAPGYWNVSPDRVVFGYSVYQAVNGGSLTPVSSAGSVWAGSIAEIVTSDVDGNGAPQYTSLLFSQAQTWTGNFLLTDLPTGKQVLLLPNVGNSWLSTGNGYDNSQFIIGWTATGPGFPRYITLTRA
jgi:hypothetical protein